MASRLFLDANVILEYLLAREHKESVRNIFLQIESGIVKAFTSTSIVQTCGYILLKVHGKVTTRKILLGMLKDISIIDCSHELAIVALNSGISDLEDAIQYYSALQHNMDYYITFDKELIKHSALNLPILTPMDFFNN